MNHIEECPSYYVDCWGTVCYCDYSHICICRELRACEERMINAAREVVAAMVTERELRSPSGLDVDIHAVIAAIDALKEKK